jgi:hypothetical protein
VVSRERFSSALHVAGSKTSLPISCRHVSDALDSSNVRSVASENTQRARVSPDARISTQN